MGYHTSNAAYAYDMHPARQAYGPSAAPEVPARERMGVVRGAGREANQDVSPVFTHCIKVIAVLIVVFFAVGVFRVTMAGMTATALNSAAGISAQLEGAREQSSDLEVMRSVYGSSTRIRDLAEGYGMVQPEGSVTLDFTEHVPAPGKTPPAKAKR